MTEDERLKWLAEPASRAEIADLLVQFGSVTATIATVCADILSEDKQSAVETMREVIKVHHEYAKLLRKFIGRADDE